MKKRKIIVSLILLISSSLNYGKNQIQAQPMYKVQITDSQLKELCKQLDPNCIIENLALYKIKNDHSVIYYAILDSLKLYKLTQYHESFKVIDQWNFKNYHHNEINENDIRRTNYVGMTIYPALYPINKDEVSIAILNQWFDGYAGGGVSEQYADFVKLQSNGKYALALGNVHFYSSEMIRACFSEKDYHTSPHCHDEYGTLLNIQFKDIGKKYYEWTLIYTDYEWPAFVSEKHKKISKRTKKVIPFGHSY